MDENGRFPAGTFKKAFPEVIMQKCPSNCPAHRTLHRLTKHFEKGEKLAFLVNPEKRIRRYTREACTQTEESAEQQNVEGPVAEVVEPTVSSLKRKIEFKQSPAKSACNISLKNVMPIRPSLFPDLHSNTSLLTSLLNPATSISETPQTRFKSLESMISVVDDEMEEQPTSSSASSAVQPVVPPPPPTRPLPQDDRMQVDEADVITLSSDDSDTPPGVQLPPAIMSVVNSQPPDYIDVE